MERKLNPFRTALAILRVSCVPPRELNETTQRFQEETYLEALKNCHPDDVVAACEDWASRIKWWPTLAELIALVAEKRAIREAASRPRLPPPVQPGSVARKQVLTVDELLVQWARNDRLFEVSMSDGSLNPDCCRMLDRIHQGLVRRRHVEHPEAAVRYYRPEVLHGRGDESMNSGHPSGG